MKLGRIVYETLNYHIKQILWPEIKSMYFLFASEIYHGSILLKIKRKHGKYFIRLKEYLSTTFSLQNDELIICVT